MAEKPRKKEVNSKAMKADAVDGESTPKTDTAQFGKISNKAELNAFLNLVRDRLTEENAAPLHALAAMHFILRQQSIYDWLDNENKEIARDIWLRLKKGGMQLRNPPMLFSEEEQSRL